MTEKPPNLPIPSPDVLLTSMLPSILDSSNQHLTQLKLQAASRAAEKLLNSYPEYAKATKPYVLSIVEILAALSEEVVAAALSVKTGVRARCTYLPTVADIVKFADEYAAQHRQFSHSVGKAVEETLAARREDEKWGIHTGSTPLMPGDRRVYHPDSGYVERVSSPHKAPGKPWGVKPEGYWTKPGFDREAWDLEEIRLEREKETAKETYNPTSSAELRTPPRPISESLKRTLAEQDYWHGKAMQEYQQKHTNDE